MSEDAFTTIPLVNGGAAIVDPEQREVLMDLKWRSRRDGRNTYAVASSGPKPLMHRFILGLTDPAIHVDHINGDGLDNRVANLRTATTRENQQNRWWRTGLSPYKGVGWHRANRKWQAQIKINRRSVYLGPFEREVDAALAYDAAAVEHFGAFANLNFPVDSAPSQRMGAS